MSTRDLPARRPTIYDIAKTAGVSHMTVSRYLRFDGERTSEKARANIKAAILELDYRPNLAARAMRTSRTGRLGILLPAGNAISSMPMLAGAARAAREAGYEVDAITLAGTTSDRSERILELAEAGLFEGLLALTPLSEHRDEQIAQRVPTVVGAKYDDEMRGIGDVADASPMDEIVSSLADLGHRHFLHICGDRAHTAARTREQAYLQAVDRKGLRSVGVVGGDWSGATAHQAIMDLPQDTEATAIIAANDVLAAAVVHGLHERGWAAPADFSVTGWDNTPVGEWLIPSLTSVSLDYVELGRRSMAQLLATMQGSALPVFTAPVGSVLWRGSTGPARRT
ncbi:LacI family DNA-binding transcriptional regulator [Nesterenkonia haasae]|uniref:LacI family DNA-binding transcriptional regulator n=1 Tax=Nesterenkonia haasae TaxID=2587813 RepID=UPI001391B153|nr:LacI family DNA-binding transcriptional regulator [Nesterenkonia haasae]NDK31121.1 LacI family transcriptional regulator [Nesterenkonia haasae]